MTITLEPPITAPSPEAARRHARVRRRARRLGRPVAAGRRAARPLTGAMPWRAGFTGAFAVSLLLFAAGRLAGAPGVAMTGVFGALIAGVGAAPVQLSPRLGLAARLTVACLFGMSVAFIAGPLLVLAPLWHPAIAAVIVLVPAIAVHARALPGAITELRASAPAARVRGTARELASALRRPALPCTLVGTGLWLGAAIAQGHVVAGIGGFLTQISPVWFAGLVLLGAGITAARNDESELVRGAGAFSLMLALTVTPALVYGMPRSQSAGKHMEIVQQVLQTHRLHAGQGIYSAYSAFFDGIAWLCRISGVRDVTTLATLWPVLMGLVRIPALLFMYREVTGNPARRWGAIVLVVLVDAIGGDYFSPQAVGYAMALGVFGLALAPREAIGPRLRGGLLIAAGCALAPTHELTPYEAGTVLLVLTLAGVGRPRWGCLALFVPAGLWALLNRGVLGGYFSLSALGHVSNFAPPKTVARAGLTRDPVVGDASHALLAGLLVLIALALVGLWRRRRERAAWAFFVSAGVGIMLLAANPYGNEGIFRAALFGIPWLALLATYAVPDRVPRVALVAWPATVLALTGTFLVANFGMDGSNVMRRADLTVLQIFNRTAPKGSALINVGFSDLPGSAPTLETTQKLIPFSLVNQPAWQQAGHPTAADGRAMLERYVTAEAAANGGHRPTALYAEWSPVSAVYAKEYGIELDSQADRWRDVLLHSGLWTVVYAHDGSYLLKAKSLAGASPSPSTVKALEAKLPAAATTALRQGAATP